MDIRLSSGFAVKRKLLRRNNYKKLEKMKKFGKTEEISKKKIKIILFLLD